MQPAQPISVIFFGSIEANSARILEYAKQLCSRRFKADVLCVDPNVDLNVDPSTGSTSLGDVHVRAAAQIETALTMAYFETVAVVQGNPAVDIHQINELVRRLSPNTFVCDYKKTKTESGYKRGLMWGHRLLNKSLLKSEVSVFDDAILLFQRTDSSIAAVRDAAHRPLALCDQENTVSHLLSGLKMTGSCRVIAVRDEFASSQALQKKIGFQSLLGATQDLVRSWWNRVMFPHPVATRIEKSSGINRGLKVGAWALLCLIAALMLNQNLKFPLFEPDEARNAQLALNILDTNTWSMLQLKNEPYWDKPPLVAWMTALSFKVFGVSENAARFPGVVVTFLTVILTCAIGQRLVGFRAAWIAGLLALLSLGVPFAGRYLTMDSTLSLMSTVTLLGIYRGSFCRQFRKGWWVAAGVGVGLGLMTKGPVILVLCAPPALLYSWLTRRKIFGSVKEAAYFVGPLVLIGCPWFLATAIATPEFLSYFLWQHHVVRFTQGMAHHQPVWFYVPVILLLMFPASQLFLPLVRFLGTRKANVRAQRTEAHGYLFLTAMWVLVFFTFSTEKLPTYILPAVPMLCLLMASVIDINVFAKLDRSEAGDDGADGVIEVKYIDGFHARLPRWFALNITGWIVLLSLVIIWLLPDYQAPLAVMVASVVLLVVATVVASHKRSHPYAAWACTAVLGLFFSTMIVNHVVPAVSKSRSIQSAVAEMRTEDGETLDSETQQPIVYYARDSFASSMKLADRNVVYFSKKETTGAAAFLRQNPNSILVASEEYLGRLEREVRMEFALVKDEMVRHLYRVTPVAYASQVADSTAAVGNSDAETSSR